MWLQISIGQGKDNNYKNNAQNMIEDLSEVGHNCLFYSLIYASFDDHIRELAPRTAAFWVLSSDARSFTFPL